MTAERISRYERLMVALTVLLSPHGWVTDDSTLAVFRHTRQVLGVRAMTDDAMWRRIAELLHEGVISSPEGSRVARYVLTAEGLTWVHENVAALGADDEDFREAMTRCGFDLDAALRKIFQVRDSQRTPDVKGRPDGDAT